eukprot:5712744-Amphidinium_carterae.1
MHTSELAAALVAGTGCRNKQLRAMLRGVNTKASQEVCPSIVADAVLASRCNHVADVYNSPSP